MKDSYRLKVILKAIDDGSILEMNCENMEVIVNREEPVVVTAGEWNRIIGKIYGDEQTKGGGMDSDKRYDVLIVSKGMPENFDSKGLTLKELKKQFTELAPLAKHMEIGGTYTQDVLGSVISIKRVE